jgi:hypothetical protein
LPKICPPFFAKFVKIFTDFSPTLDPMPSHMSPDAAAHYDRAVRDMTAEQKLASAEALWYAAWDLKAAGVRLQHPEWSASQITDRVRQLFLRATT